MNETNLIRVIIYKLKAKLTAINVSIKVEYKNGYYIPADDFNRLNKLLETSFVPIDNRPSLGYNTYFIVVHAKTLVPLKTEDGVPRMWASPEDAYDWLESKAYNPDNFPIREINFNFV